MAHLSILDKDLNLVTKDVWKGIVEAICNTSFLNLLKDEIKSKENIIKALIKAVLKRKTNYLGVLFSGGLDSTLIAKILKDNNIEFKCICVAFENSSDLNFARKAKELYNFDLHLKIITQKDIMDHLPKILNIIKGTDVVKTEVAIVVYFGLLEAKKQKIKNLFAGGGSEEIFCGYERHLSSHKKGAEHLHKESISGLISMYDRDLIRDFNLSKHFDINILLPFLDNDLIKEAMSIHPNLKTDGINKKIIIRKISKDLGLSSDFSQRKRTAAQYGSRVSAELSKLARASGYKTKLEFLKSMTIS